MSKPNPIRTHWHQLLGKLLELVLTSLGIKVHVDFNLMSKPPRADILLLRRDPCQLTWTLEQLAYLPDGIRDSSASHILAELKYTEAITNDVLEKVHGYDIFYRTTHELKKSEVATFILSSHTTNKKLLADYGYEEVMGLPGVYHSRYPMVSRVVVLMLNDLRDVPHNAFVKCFASRSTEKKKAFRALMGMGFSVLSNLSGSLWMFVAGLRRAMLGKGDNEMRVITPEDIMDLGKQMQEMLLESMTVEERLRGLRPEERLRGLGPEEVLSRYKPEEVLSRYKPEEVLSCYKPQLEQRECQGALKLLHRTLQIRFQVSPAYFGNRLEGLPLEALELLGETAVTAQTLLEFETKLNELITKTAH